MPKKLGVRILAAALGAAGGLLLAEAGLRARYFGAEALLHPSRYSPRPLPGTPFGKDGGLVPGEHGYFKGKPFSVNAHGMRDVERAERADGRVYRIAAIGDSFTMGAGVGDDETYPRQLEQTLDARCAPRRYEVLNFGVSGQDFEDDVADACGRAKTFSPDLILVGFDEMDDLPLTAPRRGYPGLARRVARAGQDSFLANLAARLLLDREAARWIGESAAATDWPAFRGQLARLRRCAGRPVLVALLQSPGLETFPWSQRVRAELRTARVETVDTAPLFRGRDRRSYWIYWSDDHPNAAADEIYARAIADSLTMTILKKDCARQRPGAGGSARVDSGRDEGVDFPADPRRRG